MGGAGGTGGGGQEHLAAGVELTEIALYQGVKRSLVVSGEQVDSDVPIIAGRDGLVRVFYQTDASYDGGTVTARLHLAGGEPLEVQGTLQGASAEADADSTLNFTIPGDRIGEELSFAVEVLALGPGADHAGARFPTEGSASVVVEGEPNQLRVVLAPFRYNADGSGRLPNLEEAQVEAIRARLLALYPVSDVSIRVREPHDWASALDPNGDGWQNAGFTLAGFRSTDGESEDVYYYGIFNPRDSFVDYCRTGCLLGVTLLNDSPPDVGNPFLRLALGVGYENYAASTAAHELGHAHGRAHVNCGPGVDPRSIDASYPHAGTTIGTWGYDITTGALKDPAEFSDIMGYCTKQHVSDYTFTALFNRGRRVNKPRVIGELRYTLIGLDGRGGAAFGGSLEREVPLEGQGVHVTLSGPHPRALRGEFFRYDHLPGGWLLVPEEEPLTRAEFTVDGQHYRVAR